ncbi:YuzB family protein [Paenibacillus sp. CC-CFT747]|nr:YuzB family protein [Paenibacillus sp. CC-CFT747]
MAKNDIRICDKCKHMKMKTMVPKLEKLAPGTEIKIGCKSYCGPCSRFAFIYINGRYVTGATEDEALEKAAKYIKK